MTEMQRKIIGKVLNIIEDRRSAYLTGMIDYMEISGSTAEIDFVINLYNYLSEKHNFNADTIREYCKQYKK